MPTLSCATWNLRVGRKPLKVAVEVDALLTRHDLDELTVQEAAAYIPAIRRRLKGRYVVATGIGTAGRDSAVISRKTLPRKRRRIHRLSRQGWERKAGRPGLHHERKMVSQIVAGIRFGAPHLPPPAGLRQPMRAAATHASWAKLHMLAARWMGTPWVMAGDWNARPDSPAALSLEVAADAQIKGSAIDWVMSHDVKVTNVRRIEHGSGDHRPVLFEVTR